MSAQRTGLICAVGLARMIAFAREQIGPVGQARGLQVLHAAVWVAVAASVLQLVRASGSRVGCLGGLIVWLAAAGISLFYGPRTGAGEGGGAGVGVGIEMNASDLMQRVTPDVGTSSKILHGPRQ